MFDSSLIILQSEKQKNVLESILEALVNFSMKKKIEETLNSPESVFQHIYNEKMERKACLSLGAWPQTPIPFNNNDLTPITKRILGQVHLAPQDILPLTFSDFCRMIGKKTKDEDESNQQAFHFQNQRRIKQVSILADIRNKYILGKDYNNPPRKTSQKGKSLIKSRELSKNSSSSASRANEFSNIKVAQALSKTKSERKVRIHPIKSPISRKDLKKEDSDYFIHYNPHKQRHEKHTEKRLIEEESTKSKGNDPKKSSFVEQRHSQYGNFFMNKNTRLRIKKDQQTSRSKDEESKQLCHELLTTMQRWDELDRQHLKQMRKMKDLNPHEKDRLTKMQEMEKNQMRNRIKRIKSRLSSQSHRV